MSWRMNIVLFIIAVALSAHLYFFENTAAPWQRLGKVFRDLEPRDLYEVEIVKPAAGADAALGADTRPIVIRKERRDGMPEAWWIVSPIAFPASHPRVQGIVYLIADLTRVAEVPEAAGAAATGEAVLVVRFKTRTGEEETIEVLRDHPDAQLDLSYVRVRGEVFVTAKEFRRIAQVALNELRSRALCPIAAQDAVFFSIAAPGAESKVMERVARGATWRLRQPIDALADREEIERLLTDLNAWTVASFVRDDSPAAGELARWGLEKPALEVTVRHRDGYFVTLQVGGPVEKAAEAGGEAGAVGAVVGEARAVVGETGAERERPPEEQVYVRHAGKPFVFAAGGKLLPALARETQAFRSRYVLDFGGEELDGLRAELVGDAGPAAGGKPAGVEVSRLELQRGVTSWRVKDLATGEAFSGDRETLDALARELRGLLVEKFVDGRGEVTAMPGRWARVELRTSAGRAMELSIGAPSDDPQDRGAEVYNVASPGEPGWYLAATRLARQLRAGPQALRRRDLSGIDPGQVVEVDLQASGRRWSLSRLPDQVEWVLATTTPLRAGTALDGARLGRLLGNLLDAMSSTSFRVRRFLPELQDFETAGLEVTRPWRAVGVRQLKEGEAGGFRKLIVGKRLPASEPPEYQARIDAADVPPFTLGAEIPDLLEEITRYLAEVTVGE